VVVQKCMGNRRMSETIFTKVDSDLGALIECICWPVSSPP
jgi:hypothetical protein